MAIFVIRNYDHIVQIMIQPNGQNYMWSWKCLKYGQFIHSITQRFNSRFVDPRDRIIGWKVMQGNLDSERAPNIPLFYLKDPHQRVVLCNP